MTNHSLRGRLPRDFESAPRLTAAAFLGKAE